MLEVPVGPSKTFLSSLLSAADEMVMKRKLKPLIIRFNEDEHLSGKPPTGREEVEFLDWEVQDQVNYIKDESNHDDSVPSRIMSVFETMDGKGEDASIYLHYSVQLLDSSIHVSIYRIRFFLFQSCSSASNRAMISAAWQQRV